MRKYLITAALGLGTIATGATAAAALAGAQTASDPAASAAAPAQTNQSNQSGQSSRLKAILDPLVKDNTINQEQADKVLAAIQNGMPDMGGKRGGGPGGPAGGQMTELAKFLGIDEATLRTEHNGKSLAQVAEAHGKTRQQLIDEMVRLENARIDQMVTEGRLTQQQADARKAETTTRVTAHVDRVMTPGAGGMGANGKRGRGGTDGTTTTTPAAPANP